MAENTNDAEREQIVRSGFRLLGLSEYDPAQSLIPSLPNFDIKAPVPSPERVTFIIGDKS